MNALDRMLAVFAPQWAMRRARARLALRHYDAATPGRRGQGWRRKHGDADAVNARAVAELRIHARDLVRNNSWARRGVNVVVNNTVGWGFRPKPVGGPGDALKKWTAWADSTDCETEGLHTFAAAQALVMRTLVISGECLVRRRLRRPADDYALPLQIQVIEPDYLDMGKSVERGIEGGPVINGVEFDAIGRRVAYWLFDAHPGTSSPSGVSHRVAASEVIHLYDVERPEQTRGTSWFASGVVGLKDLDDLEDAELMKQKIAACFAAFVTDTDGTASPIGEESDDGLIETLEPGMVHHLPPGKSVVFGNPPTTQIDTTAQRALRKVAAGLGITYEDLTGDYSQVNFSSARMARLAHWANVHAWQHHLLIPRLCQTVWRWAMEAAYPGVEIGSEWIAPAMPMIEPDKEGLAYVRRVRAGLMTPSQMIREQGYDPDAFILEYTADMKRLKDAGIVLDVDVKAVTQSGQAQSSVPGEPPAPPAPPEGEPEGEEVDLDEDEEEPARYELAELTVRKQ